MLADAQQSCYVHQQMDAYKSGCIAQACGAQVASETSSAEVSPPPQYQQIKLALDVHAASIVAVRMVDGAKPQPPQSFKPADFLEWARKQKATNLLTSGMVIVTNSVPPGLPRQFWRAVWRP